MKNNRQSKILDIIKNTEIETQEELAEHLVNIGIKVTQATISRDIKELRLVKIMAKSGKYKYAANDNDNYAFSDRFIRIFSESILSVEHANNLVVIKTLSGSANAATEALDSMNMPEIIGTLAGDNTILIVAKSEKDVNSILKKINDIKRR